MLARPCVKCHLIRYFDVGFRSSLCFHNLRGYFFCEAAGKVAKEEGKHDMGSACEDGFLDNLRVLPTSLELVSNPHSSRLECNTYALMPSEQ